MRNALIQFKPYNVVISSNKRRGDDQVEDVEV